MNAEPTYEELKIRVRELERAVAQHETAKATLHRQAQILSSIKDTIVIITPEMKTIYANEPAKDLFGDRPEMFTEPCFRFFKHRDEACDDCPVLKSIEDQSPYKAVMKSYDKNGKEIWRYHMAAPFYDRDGNVTAGIEIVTDYTTERRAEVALKESEDRYRSVLETINEGVILQSASGEILIWNKGAERIFGISSKDVIGQTSEGANWPTIHEDGSKYEGKDHPSMETLRTGKPCRNELMGVYQPSGELRWISINTNPLFGAHGDKPYAVAISFSDVTEFKRVEDALRNSERNLRQTLEATTGGIWTWNFKTNEITFSPKYYTMLGYEIDEFPADYENWVKLIHPEDRDKAIAVAEEYLKTKPDVYENEFRVATKDGDYRWIEALARVVERDENGEAVYMIGNHEDITERKHAEDALRKQNYYLEKAQELGQIGTWELDLINNELVWTDENCRIFGVPEGSVVNYETFLDKVHPDDREYVDGEWKAGVEGKPYDIEHRLLVADEVKWVREKADLEFDDNGKAVGAIGFTQNITDRKKAEKQQAAIQWELVKRNKFIEMILDALPIGLGVNYVDSGDVTYLNKKFVEIYGWSESDFPNVADFFDKVFPDPMKREILKKKIMGDIASGDPERMVWEDLEITTNKGEKRIVTGMNIPILEQNLMISTVQDVTPKRRIERSLHEAKLFLDNLSDIAYRTDRDGNVIYANPAAEKMTGSSLDEIMGRPFSPLFVDKDRHSLMDAYERTLAGESLETNLKLNSGITCHFTSLPFKDQHGNITGTFGVARDISARLASENALKESEAMHRELFDNSPTPLLIQDFSVVERRLKEIEKGKMVTDLSAYLQDNRDEVLRLAGMVKIRKSNKAARDLFRIRFQDNLFQNHALVLKSDDMQHFADQLVDFMEGKDWFEGEGRNIDSEGNILNLLIKKVVVDREQNGLSKIVVTLTDLTEIHNVLAEKEKLESRLQQAQKMEAIGNLAGGIAHDFNNILFPIVGMSELLLEDLPHQSQEYRNVQMILSAGKRGGDLVKQILAFSRQSEHKLIPVRAQQVLREVFKLIRATIPSYIEIEEDIQPDCGLLMADPTQIHQVSMNIITNAFHAVESNGGKIIVKLREVDVTADEFEGSSLAGGRYALLSIADTGHGIPPDLLNKIFEPYFTTKEQGKGTGLGLAVAYGIIKEHKGDIKVHSEVGKGTTFNVYLPLIEEAFGTGSIRQSENNPRGNERVLLVDDEEAIVNLEKQMLERLGYRVTARTSSSDALKAFKANPFAFDLVVSDMAMPNMTGIQLSKELMAIRTDIPIIICTGFSDRISQGKNSSTGIKGFLSKPISKSEMAQMVRKVLDEVRSTDQV